MPSAPADRWPLLMHDIPEGHDPPPSGTGTPWEGQEGQGWMQGRVWLPLPSSRPRIAARDVPVQRSTCIPGWNGGAGARMDPTGPGKSQESRRAHSQLRARLLTNISLSPHNRGSRAFWSWGFLPPCFRNFPIFRCFLPSSSLYPHGDATSEHLQPEKPRTHWNGSLPIPARGEAGMTLRVLKAPTSLSPFLSRGLTERGGFWHRTCSRRAPWLIDLISLIPPHQYCIILPSPCEPGPA